ncbi:ImmA/IrrE family metallo-endopeptidase [Frateuria sp. GZRe12]|uniref:ImmA/IrrE family metallo-endopeptidase n=1 Tax=Frateuria sp. GZRe12 TaxID=3351533 RepID=UPI003EDC3CBD
MANLPTEKRASARAFEVLDSTGAIARAMREGYTRVDPFYIAAQAGISVLLRPMDKLLGAFLREAGPGILLNVERPAGQIHMTCAHELGHYFMGHEDAVDDKVEYGDSASEHEREADWFAYQLLTPRRLIARVMKAKCWGLSVLSEPNVVYQLSLRLGVSFTAMVWSLSRQRLIDAPIRNRLLKVEPAAIKRQILQGVAYDGDIKRDVWLIDEFDRNTLLEPRVNDVLLAKLPNHATSGYLWDVDQARAEGFRVESLTVPSSGGDECQLLGDASLGGYRILDTLSPRGQIQWRPLVLTERRPWRPLDPRAQLELGYAPEPLAPGLTPASRASLLDEIRLT